MKPFTFAFILALVTLSIFSNAAVVNFDEVMEFRISEILEEMHDEEASSLLDNFFTEIKSIIAQLLLIRDSVPYSILQTNKVRDLMNKINGTQVCNTCQKFVNHVHKFTDKKVVEDAIKKIGMVICEKHQNQTVCMGAINSYGDIVFQALLDRVFDAYHVCERLHVCPEDTRRGGLEDYIKDVLKDKPATDYPTPTKKATYNVLHFSDPHIDLEYQAGADSQCNVPLCCRADPEGSQTTSSNPAQYWGTLGANCDIPLRTFDQFLQYVSENVEIDMILWTGDNIAHDIWNQNAANQTKNTLEATLSVRKYFPNAAIYPMFGNHEPYPADEFDTIGNASAWLTASLGDMWKVWLTDEALTTFENKSYYSVVDKTHNVKVIALDTVVCDTDDFYLIRDPTDPLDQLAWFREELYDSERQNQGVFIIGHIPPGSWGCDSSWSYRYTALIDRFTNIIKGQFYGHTHHDEFEIVRGFADHSAVGVVFMIPSMTTYSDLHPSFRIYEVDAETHQPINYRQFRLDLNFWNQNTTGPLQWDQAYEVLSEYNLKDMSFDSFDNLATRFKSEEDTLRRYLANSGTEQSFTGNLTDRDVQHIYCDVKHAVSEESLICLGLDAQVGDFMSFAHQLLPGRWYYDKC